MPKFASGLEIRADFKRFLAVILLIVAFPFVKTQFARFSYTRSLKNRRKLTQYCFQIVQTRLRLAKNCLALRFVCSLLQ